MKVFFIKQCFHIVFEKVTCYTTWSWIFASEIFGGSYLNIFYRVEGSGWKHISSKNQGTWLFHLDIFISKVFFLNVKRKKFFALKPRKRIPQQFNLQKGNFNQWKTLNEQWNVFFQLYFNTKYAYLKILYLRKASILQLLRKAVKYFYQGFILGGR